MGFLKTYPASSESRASQKGKLTTGHAYQIYCDVCVGEGNRTLTQRRFSDMVSFLDLYGLVNARVTSKGRYGKTRELSRSLSERVITKLLSGRFR